MAFLGGLFLIGIGLGLLGIYLARFLVLSTLGIYLSFRGRPSKADKDYLIGLAEDRFRQYRGKDIYFDDPYFTWEQPPRQIVGLNRRKKLYLMSDGTRVKFHIRPLAYRPNNRHL